MTLKSDISLRLMERGDVLAVAALERECFTDAWSENMILEELENELCDMYVAEISGNVVGYAGVQMILDEGYITNVAVTATQRRRGIGRALVGKLVDSAKEKKLSFITLEVRRSNESAIALYESFGFKLEGVRAGYYKNPVEDALLMTLRFHD